MAAPGTSSPLTSSPVGSISRSPLGTHLEPGALALGAETILAAGEHTQPRSRITFEGEDHIDGVLEGARPRQVAVFRDVAGEQHGDTLGLGEPDQRIGAGAHL